MLFIGLPPLLMSSGMCTNSLRVLVGISAWLLIRDVDVSPVIGNDIIARVPDVADDAWHQHEIDGLLINREPCHIVDQLLLSLLVLFDTSGLVEVGVGLIHQL